MDWQGAFLIRAKIAYPKTFWVNAPQPTAKPYATLLDVTEARRQLLQEFDLEFARIQIDVYGLKYADVQTGMEALLAALVQGATTSGHIFQRGDIALGPRDVGGEREADTIIYRKSADLIVPHRPQ